MSSFDIPPILRICKKDNDNSSSYMKKKYCISALLSEKILSEKILSEKILSEKITLTFEKDLFINEFRIGLQKQASKDTTSSMFFFTY